MKILGLVKDFFRSPHIRVALAAGTCLIVLTFVSKRVLSEPMRNIYISLPGLIMVAAEGALGVKKKGWYTNVNYYLVSAALATILIIVLHLI